MTTINHVVFDIGRVLVHYDPALPYRDIIPDADERDWFLSHVCTAEWNVEQDRGRSWTEAEDLLIAQYPDQETRIRAFRRNWHRMVPHSLDANVTILKTLLARGVDVTFLTNFAADTFHEAQALYPFLMDGRGVTVSGRVGMIKPDPAIYALHTQTFGLRREATLFIDDSEKNVRAARDHGWHAIHLPPGTALKAEMAAYEL